GRDGEVFTDFLGTLNNATWNGTMTTGCFANHCDWRLPNIEELRAIKGAGGNPTIDPIFGPTMRNLYWSASSTSDRLALGESFSRNGLGGNRPKVVYDSARAVRGPIPGCSLP